MGRGRKTRVVGDMSPEQREVLTAWQRSTTVRAGLAKRGRIILMLANGASISYISSTVPIRRRFIYTWAERFRQHGLEGLHDQAGRGRKPLFPPHVALHVVQMAPERPEPLGRSLSQWDGAELARALVDEGVVGTISAETVRRILASHKLKPWRIHRWLNPKKARDAAFYACVAALSELYTRPLARHEIVLSIDEKTSLQPRPRCQPTKPAQPGNVPNRVEPEYKRDGALPLFVAFDTRTGHVSGPCSRRTRQQEFLPFLEYLDRELPSQITRIHVVCDNVSVHHGNEVQPWVTQHPRFRFHFTPTHCSWMNQVEQWFSILQRKRFRVADFATKEDMQAKIMPFIAQGNKRAHPFNWSTNSVAKVMAEAPVAIAA